MYPALAGSYRLYHTSVLRNSYKGSICSGHYWSAGSYNYTPFSSHKQQITVVPFWLPAAGIWQGVCRIANGSSEYYDNIARSDRKWNVGRQVKTANIKTVMVHPLNSTIGFCYGMITFAVFLVYSWYILILTSLLHAQIWVLTSRQSLSTWRCQQCIIFIQSHPLCEHVDSIAHWRLNEVFFILHHM